MNAYDKFKTVNIPEFLIKDNNITADEFFVIAKILSYNTQTVSIVDIDNDYGIKKENLVSVVNKKYLQIITNGPSILVSVLPLFEGVDSNNVAVSVPTAKIVNQTNDINNLFATNEEVVSAPVMSHDFIQRITILWNQTLNSAEITKLNTWISMGFLQSDIELAIQKAIFNNAKNFNYVETILLNNKTMEQSSTSVTRNVELY